MMPQFDKETTAEQVCDAFSPRIKGRTFLITGTSARGLGAKIATTLASYSPARLILLARDKAKVDPVIEEIRSLDPDVDTRLVLCELSSQDSVRRAAGDILGDASIDKIDVVINNAAVMAVKEYTVDDRGNELQLSSNYSMLFLFLQNHDPPPPFYFLCSPPWGILQVLCVYVVLKNIYQTSTRNVVKASLTKNPSKNSRALPPHQPHPPQDPSRRPRRAHRQPHLPRPPHHALPLRGPQLQRRKRV